MRCPDLFFVVPHYVLVSATALHLEEGMDNTDWTQVDDAIREGGSSIEIWTRLGRRLGVSLEMIVMRRRTLRAPPRRHGRSANNVLPLFAPVPPMPEPLVANG